MPDACASLLCDACSNPGRCCIYQDRPTLCRNYQAGSDPLCCMSPKAPPTPFREASDAVAL